MITSRISAICNQMDRIRCVLHGVVTTTAASPVGSVAHWSSDSLGGLKALLKREDLSLHYSTMLETTPVSRLMQFLRLSRMKAEEGQMFYS